MKLHFRSGDVNLRQITKERFEEIKKTAKSVSHNGEFTLAVGEATGSSHKLIVADQERLLILEENGRFYFQLKESGQMTHTHDHETITALPSYYEQIPEREIDYFGDAVERKVVD